MNIMDTQLKRPVSHDLICFGPFRLPFACRTPCVFGWGNSALL
jgi:hypothetical protein